MPSVSAERLPPAQPRKRARSPSAPSTRSPPPTTAA